MTPQQDQLVRAHHHLVDSIAARMVRPAHRDHADARSSGFAGLMDAAATFDAERGPSFAVFAMLKIRWSILKGLASANRGRRGVDDSSSASNMTDASGEPLAGLSGRPANEVGAGEEEVVAEERRRLVAAVREHVDQLPAEHRGLVIAHYYDDLELREIAESSGHSYPTIRRRHAAALRLLRARIQGAEVRAWCCTKSSLPQIVTAP